MQLTVESVQPAKTGKSLRVKANGAWYGAKKDSGITPGSTIEAEVSEGEYGKWIDKWRAASNGNGSHAQAPVQQAKPHVQIPPTVNPPWLPFASNTVAHAIQAGLVTTPTQVVDWTRAAANAFYQVSGEI